MELAYCVWASCSLLQDELQYRGKSIHGDVGGVDDRDCHVLCWVDGAKSIYGYGLMGIELAREGGRTEFHFNFLYARLILVLL